MAQRSLVLPAHVTNRNLHQWLLLRAFQQMNFDFVLYQLEERVATKIASRLYTLLAGMCTLLKSNIVIIMMKHDQSNN